MSQSRSIFSLTLIASGAVTANHLVTFAGAQASVAGEKVAGVADYDAADKEAITVDAKGSAVIVLGGTVAVGDPLTVDASGQAVKSTLETDHVFGDALEAGTTGQKKEALLR